MYGYCWFPDSLDEPYYRGDLNVLQQGGGSEIFDLDGCMIEWEVTLGGSVKAHSLGVSIVHEVGHWLGLQHVFQSKSCEGPGDHIPDTPIQATESRGCLIGKDSCPDSPGKDSIHNYMDYSNDTCRYEFTPDQQRLIYDYWVAYRANKGSTSMVLTWEWAL